MTTTPIDSYMHSIKDSIVLSAERELELARRYRDTGDRAAENELMHSQLRFVVFIARRYTGYGLPIEDLVQEGNIGLTKAIRRFDPDKGVRLTTFASHAIRSEILDYAMRNASMVRVATTPEQKKLFFKLRSYKKSLGHLSTTDIERLATDLLVTPQHVREMEYRLARGDSSTDAPHSNTRNGSSVTLGDTLQDENADPYAELEASSEQRDSTQKLNRSMEHLDEVSRDVIQARWLGVDETSIQAVCEKYAIAPAQLKHIEQRAMRKMKKHLAAA